MNEEFSIHQLLGELKGDMQSSQRQRADLYRMVSDTAKQVTTMVEQLKTHMDREDALEAKHETLEGRVFSLEKYKNRMLGAWAVVFAGLLSAIDGVQNFFRGHS